jgi:hypothetical protein
LIGIAVVVAVVAVLVVVNRGDDDEQTTATTAVPVDIEGLPVTFEQAREEGLDLDFGDRCDTTRGVVMMPVSIAPPCVPVFEGDNGGATAKGVTGDTIKVAYYVPPPGTDAEQALQGLVDDPEDTRQTRVNLNAILNEVYETYGRTVELVQVQASGQANDDVAAKNDAVRIAEEIGAFAAIGGPGLTNVYADELVSRGVLCFQCGLVAPDTVYQKNAPYMWSVSATPEQFLVNVGDYLAFRLYQRKAEFAGDPALRDRDRVFGTIHLELDPPVFTETEQVIFEAGRELGLESAADETYLFDVARAPERAPGIIARMKEANVTTVVFFGDPVMLIYLTRAATQQNYFPEWIVTGTGFTDSTAVARLYDQEQWAHAFGLSTLPVRTPRELQDSWVLHEWWYGEPPPSQTNSSIILSNLALFFTGVHMAGPNLDPETFRAGMFRLPPRGGGAASPYVSFGDHGFYRNLDGSPRLDYLAVDDMTEIWWDADTEAVDEGGRSGRGVYRYVDGGRRYLPGTMPHTPPDVFVEEGTVIEFTRETMPADGRPPDYPPWPGSPMAGGP